MTDHAHPGEGDTAPCPACGGEAVYTRLSNGIFNTRAEAAYPGQVPDVFAWVCSRCGHEERLAPEVPSAADGGGA